LLPRFRRLFCFDGDLQKCDAKRPCTACLENGRSQCVYEERPPLQRVAKKARPIDTIRSPPSYKDKFSLGSSLSRLTSEERSLFDQSLDPSDARGSTSSSTNSTPSFVSPGKHPTPEIETAGEFGPRTPREGSMSEIVIFREAAPKPHDHAYAAESSFSIHLSIRLPSIPRGPRVPPSLLGPELLQVSDTTSSELDLSLYAFFIKSSQLRTMYAESY
jgi:hypothetical protein